MADILGALNSALQCIAEEQLSRGDFLSLSSSRLGDFSDALICRTTFFAANILCCSNLIARAGKVLNKEFPLLETVRKRAADFLLSERDPHWSFNYWSKCAEERKAMPYPDDLDDTFVALAALRGYNPDLIDGAALADMAKILMVAETKEGGPYRTWLVSPGAAPEWRDVDIAVNSNVGHFLSLLDVHLPNLKSFIEEAVVERRLSSPYYPDIFPVAYFTSRFYRTGPCASQIADMLLAERIKGGLNALQTAMLVSSFINLGFGGEVRLEDVDSLAQTTEWKPYAFCVDPARDGKRFYAGSAALTAAFVAEAIGNYLEFQELKERKNIAQSASSVFKNVKAVACEQCRALPTDLKNVALHQIDRTADKEIVLLPYRIWHALGKRGESLSPTTVENLALANLYGWMAYAIYDDFLDGEGKPLLLSAANYFLRELTLQYAAFGEDSLLFNQNLMNVIDGANAWEQQHCHFEIRNGTAELPAELPYKTIENLANRSIGHALPAVVLFLVVGVKADSPEIRRLLDFFRHYLIARQLHDDAHDWKEDFLRGRMNSVGARLIRSWRDSQRQFSGDSRRLSIGTISKFQYLFWHSEIENVVAEIGLHIVRARESLRQMEIFDDSAPLEELLDGLDRAARKTIDERALAVDFLKQYSS
jgi:hypothetical protein